MTFCPPSVPVYSKRLFLLRFRQAPPVPSLLLPPILLNMIHWKCFHNSKLLNIQQQNRHHGPCPFGALFNYFRLN